MRLGRSRAPDFRIRSAHGSQPFLPVVVRPLCLDVAAAVPADSGPRGGRDPAGIRGATLRDGGGDGPAGAADGARAGAVVRVWYPAARFLERGRRAGGG